MSEELKPCKIVGGWCIRHGHKARLLEVEYCEANEPQIATLTRPLSEAREQLGVAVRKIERLHKAAETILRWLMSVKRLDPDVEGLDATTLLAAAMRDEAASVLSALSSSGFGKVAEARDHFLDIAGKFPHECRPERAFCELCVAHDAYRAATKAAALSESNGVYKDVNSGSESKGDGR